MVAENHPRLVPASYLAGASCLLPERVGVGFHTDADRRYGNRRPPWRDQQTSPADALLSDLTPAERLVVAQVAQGLSNKEIAAALNRAEPTIKHQLSAAMQKLGVRSRCELIVRLLR